MNDKVIGYGLVSIGITIIVVAAFSVYSVFTGTSQPFALFNFEGISVPLSAFLAPELAGASSAEIEIFPAEVLNSTSNVIAHLFLMGFIVSAGAKVAMLGVNLLRPIVVKIDGKKVP